MQVVPGIDIVPHKFVVLDEIVDSFAAVSDEVVPIGVDPIAAKHPNRRRLWGSTSRNGSIDAYWIAVGQNRDGPVSIYITLYEGIQGIGAARQNFVKVGLTKPRCQIVAIQNGGRSVGKSTHLRTDRDENKDSHSADRRLLGSGESFTTEIFTWLFLE